jgi:DNA helicase-2/ATP-dependent DNA helicase PcrA
MRWKESNPDLGAWVAKVRGQLERGEVIDLDAKPVTYFQCKDDSDLSPLFEGLNAQCKSVAAIHCRRGTCDRLARFSMGSYQAIEDIAAKSLQQFASEWDSHKKGSHRAGLLKNFLKSLLTMKKRKEGEQDDESDAACWAAMQSAFEALTLSGKEDDALNAINNLRNYSRTRVFRSELLRDTTRALEGVAQGRYKTLAAGATTVRQRVSTSGRWLPYRTVSTPLLLKGLEFEYVVVPDATHFCNEGAAAKLFYVAISRARSTLVLASSKRQVQFPVPNL